MRAILRPKCSRCQVLNNSDETMKRDLFLGLARPLCQASASHFAGQGSLSGQEAYFQIFSRMRLVIAPIRVQMMPTRISGLCSVNHLSAPTLCG